ncbi:MAG: hypothetical protein IPG02_15405 [Ignavibacteria bacterium]|nr:hypothetical protein [Ignavibacteria bacterium]
MENGKWKIENGKWKVENSKCNIEKLLQTPNSPEKWATLFRHPQILNS